MAMSRDERRTGWRRWRDLVLATCTVWLLIQNVLLLTLALWANPSRALAAGAAIARTAFTMGGHLVVLVLAVIMALALAAWLVQAPAAARGTRAGHPRGAAARVGSGSNAAEEVGDGW
jgi:hypothetical protein